MNVHYLVLLLGIICAGIGGEIFVRGAVGVAQWVRVAPGIIGATVAAFATSSPELSVSIRAALTGQPQIALGDALGSNVVNIALILGVALAISGIRSPKDIRRREFPVAIAVPLVTGVLFLDGVLSRLDGLMLLGAFLVWLVMVVRDVRLQRSVTVGVLQKGRAWVFMLAFVVGLGFLTAAGSLIVSGARGIAVSFGISEFIIGATIVAVGTSMPELATTIISKYRGHDEVGLGTVLGSNIFNGLFIVAVAAIICPIEMDRRDAAGACFFGLIALSLVWPSRDGYISRGRGIALVIWYGAYLAAAIVHPLD